MRSKLWGSIAFGLLVTSQSIAASDDADDPRYLNRVESPVFEVVGDHQAITKHAAICIAQIIKPGLINAPTIVSQDNEAGVIVANNNFKFSWRGIFGMAMPDNGRTTLTFQAKDGRFRIVHTSIEQFIDATPGYAFMQQGWMKVPAGGLGPDMKKAIDAISQSLADCVKSDANAAGDW